MKLADFTIYNTKKLDIILAQCCEQVLGKHNQNDMFWGMVGACVLDTSNRAVYGVNHYMPNGKRSHAERVAINNYTKKYGSIPQGSIIITTLSPCSEHMDERYSESCTDLINSSGCHKVYCGWEDPTQSDSSSYIHKKFHVMETRNQQLQELCKKFAMTFLNQPK